MALAQSSVQTTSEDTYDPWRIEKPSIEKIARFTAREHATILFTVYDGSVGYAAGGVARRFDLPPGSPSCPRLDPALSHNGELLAYLNGETPGHCKIDILEMASWETRSLLDLTFVPSNLSWSWDDSQIAFIDARNFSPRIQSVSIRDGSLRTIVPPSQLSTRRLQSGVRISFDGRWGVQWLHTGGELMAGFSRELPTARPNVFSSYPVEYRIQLGDGGILSEFEDGYGASVSPIVDRIAWYRDSKILAENLDGTDRQILAGAPRWMLIFPGDFKGPLTWSPDGKQLLFGTFESETCRDSVYLFQIETRRSRKFLHRTCITILAWR